MNSWIQFAKTAWAHIQKFGVKQSTATLLRELWFDFENGVATTLPRQSLDALLIPYQGADPEIVRQMFARLSPAAAGTTFVDFGCGKGRVLILAAQFGFEKIIGVELDFELAMECQINLGKANHRLGNADVQIFKQDATTFDLPSGSLTIFLYNPFLGSTLNSLVKRLHTRAQNSATTLQVIYLNPVGLNQFLDNGFTVTDCLEYKGVKQGVLLELRGGSSLSIQSQNQRSFRDSATFAT